MPALLTHLRCIAVPDYYSDTELAVVNDALKLCDQSETVGLLRHSSAVATAFAHSQGPLQKNNSMFLPRIARLVPPKSIVKACCLLINSVEQVQTSCQRAQTSAASALWISGRLMAQSQW